MSESALRTRYYLYIHTLKYKFIYVNAYMPLTNSHAYMRVYKHAYVHVFVRT